MANLKRRIKNIEKVIGKDDLRTKDKEEAQKTVLLEKFVQGPGVGALIERLFRLKYQEGTEENQHMIRQELKIHWMRFIKNKFSL